MNSMDIVFACIVENDQCISKANHAGKSYAKNAEKNVKGKQFSPSIISTKEGRIKKK